MTLLEVLVAMTILAIGVVGIIGTLAAAQRAQRVSEEYTVAATLAQHVLTNLRQTPTLAAGDLSGSLEDAAVGYRWQAQVTDSDITGLLRVQLTIQWGPEVHPQAYEVCSYLRPVAAPTTTAETTTTPSSTTGGMP